MQTKRTSKQEPILVSRMNHALDGRARPLSAWGRREGRAAERQESGKLDLSASSGALSKVKQS
eukprot:501559-Rhodomonas_salina.3